MFSHTRRWHLLVVGLYACGCREDLDPPLRGLDGGSDGAGTAGQVAQRPFSEALLGQLKKPGGFSVGVFARDLGGPRSMAVGPDGSVYVTRPASNDVLRLRDLDGDGQAETRATAPSGIQGVHGVAIAGGKLFLASPRYVFAGALSADGSVAMPMAVVLDLPAGGDHPDRAIGFGTDGKLYIGVGAGCETCAESSPEHATLLQTAADGSGRRIVARGLRNSVGFAWAPGTGELWAADGGGAAHPDELNRITQGSHYGWPTCYGNRLVDRQAPDPPDGLSKEAFCGNTQPPALELGAGGLPWSLLFYGGSQFPAEYRGDAFLALRGTTEKTPLAGFKVVRVRFMGGQPASVEDFLSGFAIEGGTAYFGRPAGLAVAQDGALLLSDDANGIIYRVRYGGT